MAKSGGWFSAVKKVIGFESKHKKIEKKSCRLGQCFGKPRSVELRCADGGVGESPVEEVKLMEAENEQNRHAYSVALVTAMAAEAAVAAAHAAAEVVRLRAAACKTKEEIAAIKIQTAFRGYLARSASRGLRSRRARLTSLIGGHSQKRQAAATLKRLQTMARLQSEVRAWKIQTSDRNHSVHQQVIQNKHGKELKNLQLLKEGKWKDSTQSKEQIESKLYNKQAAAMRRERALAYAYSHQQTQRSFANQTFMDPNNPHWGWNWQDRWMAAQLQQNGSNTANKTPDCDFIAGRSTSTSLSVYSSMARTRSQPTKQYSPLTPKMPQLISSRGGTVSIISTDYSSKSMNSGQSGQCRKHSVASSSLRDDDSLTVSSPAASIPRYMASTESARAKVWLASPLRQGDGKVSARKRLSFSGSQDTVPIRVSAPAKTTAIEA